MTYTGLAPDTLISTEDGVIPIRYLTTANKVKSFCGYKNIKNIKKHFGAPTVALETCNDLPLVGGHNTKLLVKNDFCCLTKLTIGKIVADSGLVAANSIQDTASSSLLHYAKIKNDRKKQDALFVILGCLLFSSVADETVTLSKPRLIESFSVATKNFGQQAKAVQKNGVVVFNYGYVPNLCGIFERYGLPTSLDNMVQDLVLVADILSKIAFLRTLALWFEPYGDCYKLPVPNYLMRRQLQVLFNEFGISTRTSTYNTVLYLPQNTHQKLKKPEKNIKDVFAKDNIKIVSLEKFGQSDLIQLDIDGASAFLANTFLVKTNHVK